MSALFFADETDLALAKLLDRDYGGVVHPGHAQLPEVPRGTDDTEWLKVVGAKSFIVITRDRGIQDKPLERQAWRDHLVRGFVLTGRLSQRTDASFSTLASNWSEIMKLVTDGRPGPWMFSVGSQGLREVDLEFRIPRANGWRAG